MWLPLPAYEKQEHSENLKMNTHLRTLILMVLIPVLILAQTASAARAGFMERADLEGFVDEYMQRQMAAFNIPNAAVSIVHNGEVLLAKGYGYADLEAQAPVQAESSLFRIGSVAKLLTWTAVMQLVEQGQLDLDADVNTYLDFAIPPDVITIPSTEKAAPVTLRLLMTHRAGFEHYPDAIFRLSADDLLTLEDYVRQHLPKRVYPPGEVMAYSNYSAALAGYIVERVSGQPFAEYVETNIFAPLGMNHSSFRQPLPDHLQPHMTRAYRFVDGSYRAGEFEYMQEPEGSMSASAADMARFMLAHLGGGQVDGARILNEETLRLMHAQQFAYHPQQGGMAYGFMEGSFNGMRSIFHGGSTMVYDSGLYLLPEQQSGIFIVYSGGSHRLHADLFQAWIDRYYPHAQPPASQPSAGMLERSRPLTGEYLQNSRSFTTGESLTALLMGVVQVQVDEEGYLLVTINGQTDRFVEVEPGVYQNLRIGPTQDYFGPFRTLAFSSDPFGQTLLTADGPMTYSRAPWYASSAFTILALLVPLLLLSGSLMVWGVARITRFFRPRSAAPHKTCTLARMAAAAFGLLFLLFIAGVLLVGAPHPVYLLPTAAFGVLPAWDPLHAALPALMALSGLLMVIFSAVAWWKNQWTTFARIHYTLLSAASLLVLWVFNYWNIL
jgi:CubicO group peptidase (beta-lactamase class C family)